MTIEENIFKQSQINFKKLLPFGFSLQGSDYIYEEKFMNGDFIARITISPSGLVNGVVYDVANDDIYLPLRVENLNTGYIGQVKDAYEKILRKIKQACCLVNLFTQPQSNRLADFIRQKFGDSPDFPWEKYDQFGVFRNPDTNKWYGLIMPIDKKRLTPTASGQTEIINLKIDDKKIPLLLTQKGFYPAYHMNKKYWITLILDETLNDEIIFQLITESHTFSEKKSTRKKHLSSGK